MKDNAVSTISPQDELEEKVSFQHHIPKICVCSLTKRHKATYWEILDNTGIPSFTVSMSRSSFSILKESPDGP